MRQLFLFSIALIFASCGGGGSKIPASPKGPDEVNKIIAGKSWELKDLGLARISMFKKEGEAAKPEILWLSDSKDMDKNSKESLEEHNGNKFELSTDGTLKAFLKDMTMYGKQTYSVIQEDGALLFKVRVDSMNSKAFGMMQGTVLTYTVLGAEENKILIGTGSSVNNNQVVYLMESKK